MHPDMLLLAERLVVAIETMSQDVRNMSAYVYDLSCSVSYLVNDKRGKESISVVGYDEDDAPSSVTFGQHELADERASSYSGDPEHGESCFGDIASTNIDPHENSDVLSSESNMIFPGGIKLEEPSEVEVIGDSCDAHNMYGDSGSNVKISKKIKSKTHSGTGREDQVYGLHTTISRSVGQLTPAAPIAAIGFPSHPVPQASPCEETSSNFTLNRDRSAFVSRLPGGLTSVARTSQMQSARANLKARMTVDSEERPHKCSVCEKSFKTRRDMQRHTRVHTGEKPYKCNVCGSAFSLSGGLSKHMRSHTGERPFRCHICGKACGRKDHLTIHMRSHTGENPYKCNLCGKAFRYNKSLNQHMCTYSRQHPN